MKKLIAFALTAVMSITLLAGCGSKEAGSTAAAGQEDANGAVVTEENDSKTEGTVYKIGVIQYTQHDALDASNKGFFAALDEAGISYEADQQNASGDISACLSIAEKLVNDKNDLILAIATSAAQAVAGVTKDIPIVLTAITDPAESGLVADNNAPGGNITGTSDLTPVKEQIDLLKQLLPEAKKVGILYCSAESNSEIQGKAAEEACAAVGLETEIFTVSGSNEIQQVVESMVGKVDAVYAPTDNVIAANMATVSMIANDNSLPVICGESGMVKEGGLATYGIDYYQLGYMAGEMAVKILKGEADPATTPIGYLSADKCEFTGNEETAAKLNVDLSEVAK